MTFAEIMLKRMDELGMSQVELASKTGLSKQYLSSIKTGKLKDPTFGKALVIITALEMDVGSFCALLGE